LFWADDPGVTIGPGAKIPFYCAPEVAQHEPARRSADIFSLGGVFLEILTVYSNSTIEDLHQWIAGPYWKAIVPAPGIYTLELSPKRNRPESEGTANSGKITEWVEGTLQPALGQEHDGTSPNLPTTLERMMKLDHRMRPTAPELHQYFASLPEESPF
jgi:serine/threonine protein kinase